MDNILTFRGFSGSIGISFALYFHGGFYLRLIPSRGRLSQMLDSRIDGEEMSDKLLI